MTAQGPEGSPSSLVRTGVPEQGSGPHADVPPDLLELAQLPEGDPRRTALRHRVVEAHLPLVRHLARRYADRGEPMDDLVQVGTIGLLKAVDRYDADRGVPFSAFAVPTVLGEIRRHFRDRGWAVRVPRRLQELSRTLADARTELTQELGRSPTVAELAERAQVDEDAVLEGMESAGAYTTVPLDVGDIDAPGAWLATDDEALRIVEDREALRPLLARLPARERRIIALRFVRGMSQSQIAEEVGISQMHVSRLLSRTLASLRAELGDNVS
ncbi:SigB/SigF/SigG family RNA polymerase sigma factor [Quadrisphaera granulorum]|uniref:SigB/SigF/SigG family RNA polymerase sigma factor n=1 Tax=Quadrisphaera granulorum TaxID=317664 RepID=UPI000D6C3625|nr:SigB/SigF/SigG family RNA polymerase sigma factor [Quadrisphaera granulorum]